MSKRRHRRYIIEKPPGANTVYRAIFGPITVLSSADDFVLLRRLWHRMQGVEMVVKHCGAHHTLARYYSMDQRALNEDVRDSRESWLVLAKAFDTLGIDEGDDTALDCAWACLKHWRTEQIGNLIQTALEHTGE